MSPASATEAPRNLLGASVESVLEVTVLPHVFGPNCWCRPTQHGGVEIHHRLLLTYDPIPRATARMTEGVPA